MTAPLVSILMVARNAAQFIDVAILSARRQSVTDIEIVVVDDGSSDATLAVASAHAEEDPRVRVLQGPARGLSAVRNASLHAARGRFAVILDSDDFMHPRHVEGLMESQTQHDAEMCATNMIEFQQKGTGFMADAFAKGEHWRQVRSIGLGEFMEGGLIGASDVSLGYLKPLFDLQFLRSNRIAYDERLRIGEDFDLVLRAMLAGGRFVYLPQATYYYRKHATSTSHRLQHADVEGLLQATREYDSARTGAIRSHLEARCNNLTGALLHLDTIAALKAGRWIHALRLLAGNSHARRLTLSSLREAWIKRVGVSGRRVPVTHDARLTENLSKLLQALPATVPGS